VATVLVRSVRLAVFPAWWHHLGAPRVHPGVARRVGEPAPGGTHVMDAVPFVPGPSCTALVELWDDTVDNFLAGGPAVPPPLRPWRRPTEERGAARSSSTRSPNRSSGHWPAQPASSWRSTPGKPTSRSSAATASSLTRNPATPPSGAHRQGAVRDHDSNGTGIRDGHHRRTRLVVTRQKSHPTGNIESRPETATRFSHAWTDFAHLLPRRATAVAPAQRARAARRPRARHASRTSSRPPLRRPENGPTPSTSTAAE
jgi:hypothetical protein